MGKKKYARFQGHFRCKKAGNARSITACLQAVCLAYPSFVCIETMRNGKVGFVQFPIGQKKTSFRLSLNHELLMNMLRQDIKDKRLIDLIKKYLKSGVMENGIVMRTEEGSPQGGNLSPLLANIYLDKFDKDFEGRGVRVIRYADDIILLAKSIRAAERLLGTSMEYLEKKLKLKVNTEKSRAVSVYSIRNFGFLDLRWEGTGEVHISEFTQNPRRKPKKS